MENSPSYIKGLVKPNGKKPASRKVWSIDLEAVWLPFFTATNVMGDTAIPVEALGAPLRLAYAKDGSVKFSQSGRPIVKVVSELAQAVRLVRENFTATLVNHAHMVATENADGYKAAIQAAVAAGQPIIQHDRDELDKLIKAQIEQAVKDKEAKAEAVKEAESLAKAGIKVKGKGKEAVTA